MACNANNHDRATCCCGFGGGYKGSRFAPASTLDNVCWETRCPICKAVVYFVRHNGGSVWFDQLGKPWPKHPCMDRGGCYLNYGTSQLPRDARLVGPVGDDLAKWIQAKQAEAFAFWEEVVF